MKNVEMNVDRDILTIKIDLSKDFGPSKSGKTLIIATTSGNVSIPDNEEIKIGLNIYKPNREKVNRRLFDPAVCYYLAM